MKLSQTESLEKTSMVLPEYLLPVYHRYDVTLTHGKGAYLYDTNNNEYLDFSCGIGVNILGHNHPALIGTIQNYLHRPWHLSNSFRVPEAEMYAERIISRFNFDSVFLCNSGTEAVECMIKTIRSYNADKRNGTEIIAFHGAFHGRSMAAMSTSCNKAGIYNAFDPPIAGIKFAEHNNIESVMSLINENTGGILLEPIQGHGGCVEFSDEFLIFLRALCDKNDILLCYDCIQSGYGRTGDFFAYERSNAKPDMLAIAKGMGGGLPMGACIFNARTSSILKPGQHGSTSGGNPLCAALAGTVYDEVLSLLDYINIIAKEFDAALRELSRRYPDIILEAKGRGLYRALAFNKDVIGASDLSCMLLKYGLITAISGNNNLRLLPPYIIDNTHVQRFLEIMSGTLDKLKQASYG